ncbi:ABC transporter permease [Streptomyces sp. NPDC059909]|uniref:ABC transporter permease n=1 Tax=Streptomyces sp. NPDC059909 TaxID=3346998 RepID=UPI00364FFBEB
MSALTLRGMPWVVVRRHRRTLWTAIALTAAAVAAVAVTRTWYVTEYETVLRPTEWHDRLLWALDRTTTAIMFLPLLVAAFVAGPLVARDLESGTHRLLWTQSVSPARWLAAKLAVPAVVATVCATVLVGVHRWGLAPVRHSAYLELWHHPTYIALGPAGVAYVLLAVAVGALAGLLVRRTVVAMSVAGLATGSLLLAGGGLREYLWPTVMTTGPDLAESGTNWPLDSGMLTASGARLSWEDCYGAGMPQQCMAARGGVEDFAVYHPASHFWPIQFVETGVVIALAVLATAVAFRVLRRHHA